MDLEKTGKLQMDYLNSSLHGTEKLLSRRNERK